MELQDPEQLLQTVIDVIKYASCGISPDRLIVSPELWEWIKTEIDKYNSFQSPMQKHNLLIINLFSILREKDIFNMPFYFVHI